MTTASTLALTISEAEFQSKVMEYAALRGWRYVHYRTSMTPRGRYVTALQGHPGGPDLLLARDGRVLLVELKRQQGVVRPAQQAWLTQLGEHGRLWRPSDWAEIQETLR